MRVKGWEDRVKNKFFQLWHSGKAMGLTNSLICLSYIDNLLLNTEVKCKLAQGVHLSNHYIIFILEKKLF